MPTRSFVSISALNGRSFFSVILFFFDGFVPFFSSKDKNISLPRPPSLFFTFLITTAAPLNKFIGGMWLMIIVFVSEVKVKAHRFVFYINVASKPIDIRWFSCN
jgi:hypothetical protein